jgi:hypothetical protein
MAPENQSRVIRFRPGDRAVVREHSGFRGCEVEVVRVDGARGIVYLRMRLWPERPPFELELPVANADDVLELLPSNDSGEKGPATEPFAAQDAAT